MAFCMALFASHAHAAPKDYFQITVRDGETGRGVPLVELKTTDEVTYYTDSNGIAAVNDPELMGHTVYFYIKSHGYQYPADGFGYRGVSFPVMLGGKIEIKLKRLNIAERLYRLTGAGIYRDSILTGASVPLQEPLLNGQVMGQDTVEVTPYKGKLYWFFGDTNKPSYPLGQFATSGATSLLPGKGGLDPGVGVNLTYWTDSDGFSKKMLPLPGFGGPVWVGGLFTLPDASGNERLLTRYAHLDGTGKTAEQGLAMFNDDLALFEKVKAFDLNEPLVPEGHPFRATDGGQTYLYFEPTTGSAMPLVRVLADMAHVLDPHTYEGYTCLAPSSHYDGVQTRLDRDSTGKLLYGWKVNTPPLSYDQQDALLKAGKLAPDEAPFQLRDIETDAPIHSHGGSTFWNPYRRRWVMITAQAFGASSFLGEQWLAEADTPTGPWVYARKIITHDHYTFYNPTQHPFFDGDGGRVIYLEGTYTDTYSSSPEKTPRYNYNQIMYRVALDDPRLSLPAPVYYWKLVLTEIYTTDRMVGVGKRWPTVPEIPFFAVPTDHPHPGLIPLYLRPSKGGDITFQTNAPNAERKPLFYVLPPTAAVGEKVSPAVVPLYEYTDPHTHKKWYAPESGKPSATAVRTALPLCRVWRNPSSARTWDSGTQPIEPLPGVNK